MARQGFVWALAALLFLLVFVACSSDEARFEYQRNRAQTWLAEGRKDDAIGALLRAARINPDSQEVNRELGMLFAERVERAKALYFLLEAHRLDPSDVQVALSAAELLLPTDLDRAERLIEAVLERDPGHATARLRRSQLRLRARDLPGAIREAELAARADSERAQIQHHLGSVLKMQIHDTLRGGRVVHEELYGACIRALSRAGDLQPENWVARLERAWVLSVWPGHEAEARVEAWATFEATFDGVEAKKLAGGAADEMLKLADDLGDDSLYLFTLERLVDADPTNLNAWVRLAVHGTDKHELAVHGTDKHELAVHGTDKHELAVHGTDKHELAVHGTDKRELAVHGGDEGAPEASSPSERSAFPGESVFRRMLDKIPDDPRARILYATYLVEKGRSDHAIAYLEETLEEGLSPPDILGALLRQELRLGHIDRARQRLLQLEARYPDHENTALGVAQLALAERRYGAAASAIRLSRKARDTAEGVQMLVLAEYGQGNLRAALSAVGDALQLTKGSRIALMRLKGQIEYSTGDWVRTLATYQWLEQIHFELTAAERLRTAVSYYKLGDGNAGRQILEQLTAESEPHPDAVLEYAVREGGQNIARTRLLLGRALEDAPTHPGLLEAAVQIAIRIGDNDLAVAHLDRAVRASGNAPRFHALRARYLHQIGRTAEAERSALFAFEHAPGEGGIAELLVAIFRGQGKLNQLTDQFETARAQGKLDPRGSVLLARLYLADGQRERSRVLYEEALAAGAADPTAMNDLAYLLADREEDLDRALELAEQAIRSDRSNPNVVDTFGYVYLKQGRFEEAVRQFQFAIKLSGAAPRAQIHYHLAVALEGLGENQASKTQFERALSLDPDFDGAETARQKLVALSNRQQTPS